MTSEVPIYLLTGMTPNDRIFDRLLPLLPSCQVVKWLKPGATESIGQYAERLAETIPTCTCLIGGVSFGGIVALELSRVIRPHGCILVSSIRNPAQLPPWLRMCDYSRGTIASVSLMLSGGSRRCFPDKFVHGQQRGSLS